jgi:hypothetical protein
MIEREFEIALFIILSAAFSQFLKSSPALRLPSGEKRAGLHLKLGKINIAVLAFCDIIQIDNGYVHKNKAKAHRARGALLLYIGWSSIARSSVQPFANVV